MKYILMTPFERIALLKIITTLWNQDDIRALTARFYFPPFCSTVRKEKWLKIEDKVIEKVFQLPLPASLKQKILCFIKPIGLQIFKWVEYHKENCYIPLHLPNEFCWTSQGTIDKKKTAEVLVRDDNLDIARRYKLACIYCLENDIKVLWNKMPENCREYFCNTDDTRNIAQHVFVLLWTYAMKGEVPWIDNIAKRSHKCTPYQYAFECAVVDGNKVATEYILKTLTPQERKKSLARYIANKRGSSRNRPFTPIHADVLIFLLSQMNEEQQIKVFKNYSCAVLGCFLEWPWQSFFLETANRMWTFLPEEDFNFLLWNIVDNKFKPGYKDYNYQELFGEFWQQSPDTYKRFFFDRFGSGFVLKVLFRVKDKEIISLILKSATPDQKAIVFDYIGTNVCNNLVCSNEWDLLKFFIGECISSQKTVINIKERLKYSICHSSEKELEKREDKWDKCFQILDNFINGYDTEY